MPVEALVGPGYRGWYLGYLIAVFWPTSGASDMPVLPNSTMENKETNIHEIRQTRTMQFLHENVFSTHMLLLVTPDCNSALFFL